MTEVAAILWTPLKRLHKGLLGPTVVTKMFLKLRNDNMDIECRALYPWPVCELERFIGLLEDPYGTFLRTDMVSDDALDMHWTHTGDLIFGTVGKSSITIRQPQAAIIRRDLVTLLRKQSALRR